jgi:hypothetical protein
MVEVDDIRMMRNGTPVKVIAIHQKWSAYWKRDMPYVTLTTWPDRKYTFDRTLGTVSSYPLHPNYN